MKQFIAGIAAIAILPVLSSCTVAKVTGQAAALPFKGAYHGTRLAAKGVYYTGKGAYMVGKVPVQIADGALDASARVLTLTVLTLNAAGQVTSISKDIAATSLNAELAAINAGSSLLEVIVTIAS
jgi:hypothetical protein